MKTKTPILKLISYTELPQGMMAGSAYGHLKFYVSERSTIDGEEKDRTYFPLEGLVISCQIDGSKSENEPSYAWEIGWQNHGASNLYELKRFAKALAPIVREYDKAAAKYGSPLTYGRFVAMAAASMAATQIQVTAANRGEEPRLFYTPIYAIGAIDAEVLRIFNECRRREGKEPVAA